MRRPFVRRGELRVTACLKLVRHPSPHHSPLPDRGGEFDTHRGRSRLGRQAAKQFPRNPGIMAPDGALVFTAHHDASALCRLVGLPNPSLSRPGGQGVGSGHGNQNTCDFSHCSNL